MLVSPARPPSALAGRRERGYGGTAPLLWQIALEHARRQQAAALLDSAQNGSTMTEQPIEE